MQRDERSEPGEDHGKDSTGVDARTQPIARRPSQNSVAAVNPTSVMPAMTAEQFMELVRELRKPSESEQRKLDKEDEQIRRANEARLEQGKAEMQRKEMMKRGCQHATFNQATKVASHTWRAQVHTPHGKSPYFVPLCEQCHTTLPKIKANPVMLTDGVNLHNYPTLTMQELEHWAELQPAD